MSHAGHNTCLDMDCIYCSFRPFLKITWQGWVNLNKLNSERKINGKWFCTDKQEEACKRFKVVLTDYIPKSERPPEGILGKIIHRIKEYRNKRKNQGLFKKFKDILDKQHESNKKRKKKKGITLNDILGPPKSASYISKQDKDLDFITGRGKKPDMNFITGKSKKTNMSFITGGRKQNYSGLLSKNKPSSLSLGKKQNYSGLLGKKKRVKL